MSVRTALRSFLATDRTPPARRPRRFAVEQLEDRTVPTAVAAPSGLVSWWTGQSTAADTTGLNNATLYNGATYAAGEVGQAFSFDGVNGRASVADSASLKLTTSLTIEGWIKVNAFPTSGLGEIFFRGDDTRSPYSLSADPNGLLNFAIFPLTTNGSSLVVHLVPGVLTHVAATLDGATGLMSLYVNGVLAAQTTTDVRPYGDLQPASHPGVGIGNTGGYPGTATNSPFNGVIDELSVYNRALTPGEVLGICKAGTSGKVSSPIAVDGPSVVEGSAGTTTPMTFTIQRTGSLSGSLTVNWATVDDSATAGSDYAAAAGSIIFLDGEATKTVQVTVNGDNIGEANETFRLITTPAGGTQVMGVATVLNDDSAITVGNASAVEGDAAIRYFDDFVPVQRQLGGGRHDAFGPDGNLYIASRFTNDVQKFDGQTGAYLGTVVPAGSFGLHAPWPVVIGPDNNLYVGGTLSGNVLRYNFTTGAVDEFVSSSSGLAIANGLAFDAAGNLLVSTGNGSSVWRFQGPGGASPGVPLPAPGQTGAVFVPQGSGGLNSAQGGMTFGPDGNLYVCSFNTNSVIRYNGTTGALIDTFVAAGSGGLSGPNDLAFRPDGFLYVSSQNNAAVYRYNATTGAFASTVAQSPNPYGAGGLAWDAVGNLLVSLNAGSNMQTRYGRYGAASQEAFTVTLDYASAVPITVSYSTADGTATAGSGYVQKSGTVVFAPGETTKTVLVQTINDALVEPNRTFALNLSNPVGATVTRAQATGTIIDDDTTKFYVANDGSTDRTYRYGVPGNALADTALGSGDTAPRGMAATAAGDRVWVADANKTVYVYSAAGALLGSWTAGGLPGNAQIEGLATNGTDVWLLDNKQDKVFRYAGAATRLSGSQSAASSFALTAADTNAKGIVTDGISFWVVDDGASTDKVFKYTLTGGLLGSWTIDAANASPTGLTINPAGVSDIWIVDNGTDRVYQYAAAAGRTSGSQTASATFALAPGYTNPQDIADPPPGPATPAQTATVAWPATTPSVVAAAGINPAAGPVVHRPASLVSETYRAGGAATFAPARRLTGRVQAVAFDLTPIDVNSPRAATRRF